MIICDLASPSNERKKANKAWYERLQSWSAVTETFIFGIDERSKAFNTYLYFNIFEV